MTLTLKESVARMEHVFEIEDVQSGRVSSATITVRDGRFEKCTFPFHGAYTRDQWRVLGLLSAKIMELTEA